MTRLPSSNYAHLLFLQKYGGCAFPSSITLQHRSCQQLFQAQRDQIQDIFVLNAFNLAHTIIVKLLILNCTYRY